MARESERALTRDFSFAQMAIGSVDWRSIGAQRQTELLDAIPEERRIPTPSYQQYNKVELAMSYLTIEERKLVESSATQTLKHIKSGA